jgi:hypothetical protein
MADSAKDAWGDVGEKFSSWGRRVADRYREAGSSEEEVQESQRELLRVAKDVVDELARGFTAVGRTFRDDEANHDLQDAVSAIGDAFTATVNEATEGLRSGRSNQAGGDAGGPEDSEDSEDSEGPEDATPPPPPPTG